MTKIKIKSKRSDCADPACGCGNNTISPDESTESAAFPACDLRTREDGKKSDPCNCNIPNDGGHDHDGHNHDNHDHADAEGCCTEDGCNCGDLDEDWSPRTMIIRLLVSGALLAGAMLVDLAWAKYVLFAASYLTAGYDVLLRAFKNITKARVFDENLLMTIATIGAFAIAEAPEGVAVMLFYQTGELFQSLAVHRSRKSIADLMDIRPDSANLVTEGGSKRVSPAEVAVGDFILVLPGEKIPLDGVVVEGEGFVDTSALTGESAPRDIEVGSEVLGGFVNGSGLLRIRVEKAFGESTVSKILNLVQSATSRKAPAENFITKFARVYTPVVVILAVLIALLPPIITGTAFYGWFYRALVFLVVSCPCALVMSIPLSFFAGLGGASRNGILVKGSNYLEALNSVDTVVFDKTGTLTKGIFVVTALSPAPGFDQETLLMYSAYAESFSSHPIAQSIAASYGKSIDSARITSYREVAGRGISAVVDGKTVLAGKAAFMAEEGIAYAAAASQGTVVYTAVNGVYIGSIALVDEIKEDSKAAITSLHSRGIRTIMLTGDTETVAASVSASLGIDEWRSSLLPHQKVEALESINPRKKGGKLVFVGDGVNDAPVLARADIGIAMGALGSDAAIEAADVVLMSDQPSRIATAIDIAQRTRSIVAQNIVFALAVKVIVLILSLVGYAGMAHAVFADVGVCLLAVLNALRAMRKVK